MNKNYLKRNFLFSVFSTLVQFVQSLWVTSLIQRTLGIEAYGYISVIVNIVNMAGIVTVALTSVCSRYMVIDLEKKNYEKSKKTFNTIYFSLLFISGICIIIFGVIVINLSNFINISAQYVEQVSLLMIIVGMDFILQLLQVPYLSFFYYEEKLYYNYGMTILSNIIKVLFVMIIFHIWKPVVWGAYVGAAIVNGIALGVYGIYVKKNYPDIKKSVKYFDIFKLKDVLKSGVWVSLSKLAATLLSSCSTYLVNILIGTYMAGIYGSIAQVQSILSFITIAVINIFLPRMYRIYATDKKTELINYTSEGIKIISIVLGIVVGGFIIFGDEFMSIWISKEYLKYNLLLIISVSYLAFAYSAEMLNQLLITIDKTKIPAFFSIIAGVVNIVMAFFFIKIIDFGIYGISVAQMIVLCIRSGLLIPIYAAYCLKQKWYIFIEKQFCCIESIIVTMGICYLFGSWFVVDSWIRLFIVGSCSGIIAVIILLLLDKNLREIAKNWFGSSKRYKN